MPDWDAILITIASLRYRLLAITVVLVFLLCMFAALGYRRLTPVATLLLGDVHS